MRRAGQRPGVFPGEKEHGESARRRGRGAGGSTRYPRARRSGESGARSTGGPGGSLVVCAPAVPRLPFQVETGEDD